MESNKSIIKSILAKDISKIEVKDAESSSLYEDFPDKERIDELNELRIMQLILARKAVIEKSGYLGEQLSNGEYLHGDQSKSNWIIYKLNDGTGRIGILWSHFDNDSWSVFFKGDNLELDYLYYEN